MATGDLKNNLRRLQSKVKLINYPKDMDMKGVSTGLAQAFLPLLHYTLLDFSRPVAEHIVNNNIELYGKSDDTFMEAVYKVLRDIFHYKPSITRQQFFSHRFAEHKIILVVDLIRMVKEKHKELTKGSPGATHAPGSLARSRATPSRKMFLTASSSEATVFLPTTTETSKITEKDTGYHTAETSPTIKTPDNQSDTDLEESPVIQALVKRIVHLEDQLTEMYEAQVEKMQSDMQAPMVLVLMQNTIMIYMLEREVPTEPAEVLTQGLAQDLATALLHLVRRRPEDIPLPDSPAIPRTPNHTPLSKCWQ